MADFLVNSIYEIQANSTGFLISVAVVLCLLSLMLGYIFLPDKYSANFGLVCGLSFGVVACFGLVLWVYGVDSFFSCLVDLVQKLSTGTWIEVVAVIGGYFVVGMLWAFAHFWLYANRLGRLYRDLRAQWLDQQALDSLDDLTEAQVDSFKKNVIMEVCSQMIYKGEFPLAVMQQKLFWVANVWFWPITLLWYIGSDFIAEIYHKIANCFNKVLYRWWYSKMSLIESHRAAERNS